MHELRYEAILRAYQKLQEPREVEKKKEAIRDFYLNLRDELLEEDISLQDFNKRRGEYLDKGNLIRREDPERVLELIARDTPIHIHTDGNDYANASIDTDEGLTVALTEGRSGTDIVTVIGFAPGHVKKKNVTPAQSDLRDSRRFAVIRSIEGDITKKDIDFIVFRFPSDCLPDRDLSEREQDLKEEGKLPVIYRIASFRDTSVEGDIAA